MKISLTERSGPRGSNISWPPCSPDFTEMEFFVLGFDLEKIYVKNYENFADLKESNTTVFLDLTNQIIYYSLKNMEKPLKLLVERRGVHVEN